MSRENCARTKNLLVPSEHFLEHAVSHFNYSLCVDILCVPNERMAGDVIDISAWFYPGSKDSVTFKKNICSHKFQQF